MTIANGNSATAPDVLAIAATANSALTAAGAASANAATALSNSISAETIAAQAFTIHCIIDTHGHYRCQMFEQIRSECRREMPRVVTALTEHADHAAM